MEKGQRFAIREGGRTIGAGRDQRSGQLVRSVNYCAGRRKSVASVLVQLRVRLNFSVGR
jgi:hypothetical protein